MFIQQNVKKRKFKRKNKTSLTIRSKTFLKKIKMPIKKSTEYKTETKLAL